jgi:Abnormal spindle-like microcephaly-assoc'd, ASPM-SPD-2-Hydin
MPTFLSQITRQVSSTCHRFDRNALLSAVFFLAACSSGLQGQATAQVSIVGPAQVRLGGHAQYSALVGGATASAVVWSVNGFAGGSSSTGTISASGKYSPASTILAGHSVTIRAATESEPASTASLKVKVLNPLPIFASGSITQTAPGSRFLLDTHGSGFVSASQLQVAGANVATIFISSTELRSTISLPAGKATVNVGVLNPEAEQKTPVTRTLPVQAAASSAALSTFSCSTASMAGSGSDGCTVTLTAAAGSGGLSVSLGSSNAAVTVPATVTVPANASSAGFTAGVSSVTSPQAVALTASAGGVSRSFAVQLNATIPTLTISPPSVAFGNVAVNTPTTLPVTLTSTGTVPVTINSGTLSGTGYTMSGATFPVTLNPNLAVTLDVQFDPAAAGTASGQLTIQSNSSTNGTVVISLSGTGETVSHQTNLSWEAPSSSADPVVGYNVYRSAAGSSAYQRLNSSANTQTTYVDSTVQAGLTYDYYVTSVDPSGVESVPSNQVAATIP